MTQNVELQVATCHAAAFKAACELIELIASGDRAAAARFRESMEAADVHARQFIEAMNAGYQEIGRFAAESLQAGHREIAAHLCRSANVTRSAVFVEVARTMSAMIAEGQKMLHLVGSVNVTTDAGKDNVDA